MTLNSPDYLLILSARLLLENFSTGFAGSPPFERHRVRGGSIEQAGQNYSNPLRLHLVLYITCRDRPRSIPET
jgi:hypothetical protein